MGDGSAIGGWILTAAIITVLAGGANAVNNSPDRTNRTPTPSPSSTATTTAAPSCTRVSRAVSADGRYYKVVPVAANGDVDCRLRTGDKGRPVTVLQQALRMCSNRTVQVDGTFTKDTSTALSRDQERQLALKPTGIYDPATARRVRWPWYDLRNKDTFTGLCGQVADRAAQ